MTRSILLATIVLAALPLAHASAQTYKFDKISYKGSLATAMSDINASGVLTGGFFKNGATLRKCFVYDTKTKTSVALRHPKQYSGTQCWGLNDAGVIVGYYDTNAAGADVGFVYANGSFTDIMPPGATTAQVEGISNTGTICGFFVDSGGTQHGFIYDGTTYTTVDQKGDNTVFVFSINSSGQYVVEGLNSKNESVSYLYTGGAATQIKFPGAVENAAHHINDNGILAATWIDSSNVLHGGIYDSGAATYTVVDHPNAGLTVADGINIKGIMAGRFQITTSSKSTGYRAVPK